MKKYPVIVEASAKRDIESQYLFLKQHSPSAAVKWFNGISAAVSALEMMPNLHGIAPESKEFRITIRHAIYGRRKHRYRILFSVVRDRVHVLHVRHGAQNVMSAEDIRFDINEGSGADHRV